MIDDRKRPSEEQQKSSPGYPIGAVFGFFFYILILAMALNAIQTLFNAISALNQG